MNAAALRTRLRKIRKTQRKDAQLHISAFKPLPANTCIDLLDPWSRSESGVGPFYVFYVMLKLRKHFPLIWIACVLEQGLKEGG